MAKCQFLMKYKETFTIWDIYDIFEYHFPVCIKIYVKYNNGLSRNASRFLVLCQVLCQVNAIVEPFSYFHFIFFMDFNILINRMHYLYWILWEASNYIFIKKKARNKYKRSSRWTHPKFGSWIRICTSFRYISFIGFIQCFRHLLFQFKNKYIKLTSAYLIWNWFLLHCWCDIKWQRFKITNLKWLRIHFLKVPY